MNDRIARSLRGLAIVTMVAAGLTITGTGKPTPTGAKLLNGTTKLSEKITTLSFNNITKLQFAELSRTVLKAGDTLSAAATVVKSEVTTKVIADNLGGTDAEAVCTLTSADKSGGVETNSNTSTLETTTLNFSTLTS